MDRTRAQTIMDNLDAATREGRWTPGDMARQAMNGLGMALCCRIHAGQPALEAMNDRLMATYADTALELAAADNRACRYAAPTLADIRMFETAPVRDNVVSIDIQRTSRLARAA